MVLQTVQWTKLQQIEDLEPICEGEYGVLEEIRQVLLRWGYQNRFGVSAAQAFRLAAGEAFLEQSDEAARVSTITVVPEDIAKEAMEAAWSFTSGDDIRAG
jgi:hypothetical protein